MRGDRAVQSAAEKLEALASRAAAKGGVAATLSRELAEDASFLRRLKPSLILARAQGRLPKDAEPGAGAPQAPSMPQHESVAGHKRGPNPFAVAGAAFGAGTILAKIIDWRGHAHPRR